MPSCAHVYCRNSTKSYKAADGRRISFHRFPSEPSVRQLWLENLQREGFTPSSRSVLCSEHFKGTCFDHRAGKWSNPRLQYGAVPTLFHREGDIKKKGDDKRDDSSDDEPGSWSGWHSWPEKEGSTDQQKDPSQGLKELEELMEEEEEREDIEEFMEDEELEDGNEKEAITGSPEKEEEESKEEEDEEGEEKEEEETGTETDIVRKVLKQAGEHDKITLDNVTMDPTLTSVRVGDQRMVSMTFQDILNSLIPAQPKDSSKEPSNPNSDEVKGHQDKPDPDTGHPSHGQEADQGDWLYQPSEATSFTPQFRQILKRRSEAAQKAKARKEAKKKKRDEKMVLSVYRKNTMMRVIYAKDLPYICGDCGLAFTHASVLKNHVETKHDYTEPTEMKANGEISSQVVIHRDFEKGNLKTGAEIKELRKKYPKTEFCNGNDEDSEQLLENIEKTIPPSDSDEGFSLGNVGGDSSISHSFAEREGSSHKKKKKKRKRSRKPKTDSDGNAAPGRKHRDRCHRCPNYFPSLFQKKLHMAEVHGEYTSQEAAQESWKEMADDSSTLQVLKCMYCDTFFTDSANTQGHLNKHCGLDGIKCDVCEEAIKMWNEGRNMELGNLLRKYEGVQEASQDGDDRETMESENDGDGATGDGEKKCDEESAVYDESTEQQDPADLIRRSLERANGISNKNFFILTCFECNEQFFLRHHLVNHYRLHEKFTCKECGEEFETMTKYQEHSDEVHKVGLCQCLYCPKKFPSLGKLNFHMLGHLGLFQCIVCKMTVMSKQSLEMHIRSAANDPGHKVPTDGERITYSSSNPFQGSGHLGRQFGWRGGTAKVKNISCQFCDRKFGYIHGLRKHIRCLHPNESVPMQGDGFCCDRCGIVLASKASMKAHLKTHQERTIACPKADCNAMFTTKANLSSHLKTHSRTSWRYKFKCDVCNGTYKTKHYLEIHKKSHTGQVPYACSYCGKAFRNVTHMVYHERRMHTGQLDHTCEVCGKGFADPSTLKVHTKTHASHRPFVCDFCSKDFPTELYLRAHRRVHTKPFKCSQCDEGFSQQGARRNHMRKVHGIEMPVKRIKAKDTVHNETNRDVSQMNESALHDIDVTEAMVIADSTDEVISLLASLS